MFSSVCRSIFLSASGEVCLRTRSISLPRFADVMTVKYCSRHNRAKESRKQLGLSLPECGTENKKAIYRAEAGLKPSEATRSTHLMRQTAEIRAGAWSAILHG